MNCLVRREIDQLVAKYCDYTLRISVPFTVTHSNKYSLSIMTHFMLCFCLKEFQEQVHGFTEGVVSTFNKVPIPRISFRTSEQSAVVEAAKL